MSQVRQIHCRPPLFLCQIHVLLPGVHIQDNGNYGNNNTPPSCVWKLRSHGLNIP